MPQLYVFRHAKSSWADTGLQDFDRPLANRGLKAAPAMGAHMRAAKIRPDFILCSTSRRTRETLGLILPFLEGEARILMEDAIYGARDEASLIERLRRVPADIKSAMVIGHNPIMQDLTLTLDAGTTDSDVRRRVAEKFPTAALATIDLMDAPWPAVTQGCGTLTAFVVPREIQ